MHQKPPFKILGLSDYVIACHGWPTIHILDQKVANCLCVVPLLDKGSGTPIIVMCFIQPPFAEEYY